MFSGGRERMHWEQMGSNKDFEKNMAKFGEEWNFPYAFPAVDGSHFAIKYPNGHGPKFFQITYLWGHIVEGEAVPKLEQKVEDVEITPLVLGDGTFPLTK